MPAGVYQVDQTVFGKVRASRFMATAVFGELGLSLVVAGAIFGELDRRPLTFISSFLLVRTSVPEIRNTKQSKTKQPLCLCLSECGPYLCSCKQAGKQQEGK